ncbi:tyrosine-type recombinase/integrase [Paraburkholderia sediminicola]|uniref:Tyrosine-type recombinase/integrase n=1 Tax=Paraburkholderia rhynchosiae TaxID=487049 RepID=A0ACC7NLJ5_9BURK
MQQGYPRASLRKIAWVLLAFSQSLDLSQTKRITREEIAFAVDHRIRFARRPEHALESRSSRLLFIHIATAWLRFLGYLEENLVERQPFAHMVDDFSYFMAEERGLSAATITFRREQVTHFLDMTWPAKGGLNAITIQDVNAYLAQQGNRGWSRRSLHTLADALRSFFRYAWSQGWAGNIAAAITSPRIYAQEGLPIGPRWDEVQQLIGCFAGNSAVDLRDRAIVLLLAVYGLRRSEVARLRLEDLDWTGEKVYVTRPKQRCTQQYPLDPVVGDAIVRYLKEARPRCVYRQLFLSLDAPIRPLLPGCISPIVRSRLTALGIQTPRRGAHCLRHACARQLLAGGFSLKQIGDQLGHRSAAATRAYVKVDLDGLRQVAELNLEALL